MSRKADPKQRLNYVRGASWDAIRLKAARSAPDMGDVSNRAVAALTEAFLPWARRVAIDAESFAVHAGRRRVKAADVALVARGNRAVSERVAAAGAAHQVEAAEKKKSLSRGVWVLLFGMLTLGKGCGWCVG